MNQSDPFSRCNFSSWLEDLNDKSYYAIYTVLTPVYFVFGSIGRIVSIVGFIHQAKMESAYLLQIFMAFTELIEVFTFSFYIATRYLWSGISKLGSAWFMKCWLCMFIDAHFSNPFQMTAALCSRMLSLFLTFDRIYALAKPVKYHAKGNRKKGHWRIFIFCICFSFILNFADIFYFSPYWDEEKGEYRNLPNLRWRNIIQTAVNIQSIINLIFAIILAVAGVVLAFIFQYRMRNRASLGFGSRNGREETERVKLLFWLTFIQAVLSSASASGEFAYQLVTWMGYMFNVWDADCVGLVLGPFDDAIKEIANMVEFYVVFALMPPFRQLVKEGLKQMIGYGRTRVIPIKIQPVPVSVIRRM